MKKEISIKHEDYMMTIAEVVSSVENTFGCKVVKLTQDDEKLTFTLEYPEAESVDSGYITPWDDECKMCGRERSLNSEGYCGSCWVIWNS